MTCSAITRTNTDSTSKVCRRGITLLEVLISMFVALVGLSGLAALFWLGGVEMSEGAKLDRVMSVARAAQRSLKIYGILRPVQTYTSTIGGVPTTNAMQMWVAPNPNTPTHAQFVDSSVPGGTGSQAPVMPFGTPSNPFPYGYYTQGFAIDPIGMVVNQGQNDQFSNPLAPAFPSVDATSGSAGTPPAAIVYTAGGAAATSGPPSTAYGVSAVSIVPCLSRVTLMAYPQALLPVGTTTPTITTSSVPAGQTYTAGQADLVFRSGDDLLLNPPNGDFPPTQLFSSAGPAARRQSQGDYSWLATVVPSYRDYQVNTSGATPVYTPLGDTNLVRVSIVVFYKRVPQILIDPTFVTPPSERMVKVVNTPLFPGTTTPTGVSGGDIQLECIKPSFLNLKAGQWIMLSQIQQGPWSIAGGPVNTKAVGNYWYRWYKVVATGAVLPSPGGVIYYRNITLSGPDWNPLVETFASIIDGVVGVYEKEIELEPSGAPLAPN